MPDERRGTEAQRKARFQRAPADIDVVAGGGELRVEAADPLEHRLAKYHVAAGQMFGAVFRGQDLAGRAGRGRDAASMRPASWGA